MTPSKTLQPCDFIILGATGDLASRKLLPALYMYQLEDRLPPDFQIIAVSNFDLSAEDFCAHCKGDGVVENGDGDVNRGYGAVKRFIEAKGVWDEEVWDAFSRRLYHAEAQLREPRSDLSKLAEILDRTPSDLRVFYMALPSDLMGPACDKIRDQGIASERDRVVLEKPIGTSLAGAEQLHRTAVQAFSEDNIYRIDHYLGKETVHSIPALRSDSSLLGLLWNHAWVERVEISVSEKIGAADRIDYYEAVGALRDMAQNHLLQILCLVAMESPESIDKAALQSAKCNVLKSLSEIEKGDSKRAQYVAGNGNRGYAEEVAAFHGADDMTRTPYSTQTETFVALRVRLDDSIRWKDVPFILRTGKRLEKREAQVVVHFATSPTSDASVTPERLVIHIQPDDGATLFASINGRSSSESAEVPLELHFPRAFPNIRTPEAYERLLADVVNGDSSLFVSAAEVEASWEWIEKIMDMWNSSNAPDLLFYPAGATGPTIGDWLHDGRASKTSG
ncbi:hypothetical protein ACFU6S_16900 [Streptomyces sp. NPDC057456]|uniref:hypothetical protein n=1 Tax=Streptomyces sp. NPDC057456 TaxID=3346139 RepID=UPI00369E2665